MILARAIEPRLGTYKPPAYLAKLRQPRVPAEPAYGCAFLAQADIATFRELTSSYQRLLAMIDLASQRGIKALTVCFEVLPKSVNEGFLKNRVLIINAADLTVPQMKHILNKLKRHGLYLDIHCPWLSGSAGRGSLMEGPTQFSYPDPRNNPQTFKNIIKFAQLYHQINQHKLEVTIHLSGKPEDWIPWLKVLGQVAIINVENAFIYHQSASQEHPQTSFDYFNASTTVTISEYFTWLENLTRQLQGTVVEVRCLIDIAHAAIGENNPQAYLHFIAEAVKRGFTVGRLHVANFDLAGTTLSDKDPHGPVEFDRKTEQQKARSLSLPDQVEQVLKRVALTVESKEFEPSSTLLCTKPQLGPTIKIIGS